MLYLERIIEKLLVVRLGCPKTGPDTQLQVLSGQAFEDKESILTATCVAALSVNRVL